MEKVEYDPQLVIAILKQKAAVDQVLALHLEAAIWQSIAVTRTDMASQSHQDEPKKPLEAI